MLTFDDLADRRAQIAASADLTALRDRLVARARPLMAAMPPAADVKALLSRDGGACPNDGAPLEFDPWSPDNHRCSKCRETFSGDRHHAHWARMQHLWLAERAAHLATLHAVTGEAEYATRARELLALYYERYFALRNWDNVLGPSHLFFSTYLESIWILNYLAAAYLLRETGALSDEDLAQIDAIADEAATLISEFNEGFSNRQTWHSAALVAIATWFGDEELAVHSIEGRTGLLGHLGQAFGDDGLWYEGENYHLFALRGLMIGLWWARLAGAEALEDPAVVAHLNTVLLASSVTALPDRTFPARKDSRYGVSLAFPAYTETWEAARGLLGESAAELDAWLTALYSAPVQNEQTYDSYLHDSGVEAERRSRAELSWWALLTMAPSLSTEGPEWQPATRFLPGQKLAILATDTSYLSLECGGGGSGHGHPDRLHLSLHSNGVPWLVDAGTGSYVTHDLFWYRSTLAHNAPRLDSQDQPAGDSSRCAAFDQSGGWAWASGVWGDVRRSVIHGPEWTLDIVTLDATATHQLEVPWHLGGSMTLQSQGEWQPGVLASEYVRGVEQLDGAERPVRFDAANGPQTLACWFGGDGDLLRADGPGLPTIGGLRPFLLRRATGAQLTFVTLLDRTGTVTAFNSEGRTATIDQAALRTAVQVSGNEAIVTLPASVVTLRGGIGTPVQLPSVPKDRPMVAQGVAQWVAAAPILDGTLAGFDRASPLHLDDEQHYFRSEVPYPGPDAFAARAWVNWSEDHLFVAAEVDKSPIVLRPADAAPLLLDNEPEDIHSDGIQVYLRMPGQPMQSWLARPGDRNTLAIRPIDGPSTEPPHGAWQVTPAGYRITIALPVKGIQHLLVGELLEFDLVVNEMRPDRQRRAGQLIWANGPGWVYLRGDRHGLSHLGALSLAG